MEDIEEEEEDFDLAALEADEELNLEFAHLMTGGGGVDGGGGAGGKVAESAVHKSEPTLLAEEVILESEEDDPELLAQLEAISRPLVASVVPPLPPSKQPRLQQQQQQKQKHRVEQATSEQHAAPASIAKTATTSTASTSTATKSKAAASTAVAAMSPYASLEKALRDAKASATQEAKAFLEAKNQKAAKEKLERAKLYQQELMVLEARRGLGPEALALWHFETIRREEHIVNTSIAENELVFHMQGVFDLRSEQGAEGKKISIEYDLGLPRDGAVQGALPAALYSRGKAEYNSVQRLPILKRSAASEFTLARKSTCAFFTLTLHKGGFLWNSTVVLGHAKLLYADLLASSKIGGSLPLFKILEPKTEGSRGKEEAIGGCLKVTVQARCPLKTPELLVSEERQLVLGPWPTNVVDRVADSMAASGATSQLVETEMLPSKQEMEMPLHTDFYVSFDVLSEEDALITAELDTLQNKATSVSEEDESRIFELSGRAVIIKSKLLLLQRDVQQEKLTIQEYLAAVTRRRDADLLLAKCLKKRGDIENAKKVEYRAVVMTSEINNALAMQQEGECEHVE